jgi:hypothetical protein
MPHRLVSEKKLTAASALPPRCLCVRPRQLSSAIVEGCGLRFVEGSGQMDAGCIRDRGDPRSGNLPHALRTRTRLS